jgi:hypothetical protein
MSNSWILFLKEYREKHPELSYKECMVQAKTIYQPSKKKKEDKKETVDIIVDKKEEDKKTVPIIMNTPRGYKPRKLF